MTASTNEITWKTNSDSILVSVADSRIENEIRELAKKNSDINILLTTPQLVATVPVKYLHFQ